MSTWPAARHALRDLCALQFALAALVAGLIAGPAWAGQLVLDFEGGVSVRDDANGLVAHWTGASLSSLDAAAKAQGIGRPQVQYEGGNEAQRWARVVPDPIRRGNSVLEFVARRPNVLAADDGAGKSRVQLNLYGNDAANEVYLSVRMYLSPALATLRELPRSFDWLTLSEWWHQAPWTGAAHPFRISVNLTKPEAAQGSPLRLAVHAQAMRPGRRDFRGADLWAASAGQWTVPLGVWLRLQYYYREGHGGDGRFALAVTQDGGDRLDLFDLAQPTLHPDATVGEGARHLNPVKLYTSALLTNFVADRGGELRVLWDDLAMQTCAAPRPGAVSECWGRWQAR